MAITISGENNNDRILASDGVIDQLSGFNVVGVITATSFTGDLTGDVTGNLTGNVTGNINNSTLLLQTGGTERLRITSDGKIGIGNNNPARILDVNGTARFSNGASIEWGGTSASIAGESSSNTLFFRTASAERLRITSTGNVGIGTDNPGRELDVYKGTGNDCTIVARVKSAGAWFEANSETSSGYYGLKLRNGNTEKWFLGSYGSNNLQLKTATANASSLLEITSDGKVGISETAPQALLHLNDGANSAIMFGNTTHGYKIRSNVTSSNDYGLLIEDEDGVDLYRAVSSTGSSNADTHTFFTAGEERLRIDSNGDVGINATNPTQKLHVGGGIKLTAQLMQSMPADFWSQGNTFIELNGVGNLTHMGSYETCLTSNGYRDNNLQWKSYAINSITGASQIRLNPNGYIVFGTESNKANGSSHNVTERLRITSRGYREIRNYHYGPYAFTNDTWKSTFTIGDPGDHKHTTIKFILTIIDGAYRQGFWQGEFVIWSSNAVGGPGVSHIYKKIWDNVGSTNWSGGTVQYQMSGGAFQFKADNSHDDAAGNAYIHILDVIGDIDGSTVASISS